MPYVRASRFFVFMLLLCILFNCGTLSADKATDNNRRIPLDLYKSRLAAEPIEANDTGPSDADSDFSDISQYRGSDQRGSELPQASPGSPVGFTTYDYQHDMRTTRQIAWRGTHDIHFAWMKKNNVNPQVGSGVRVTSYQFWNATIGNFSWSPFDNFGGDDLHSSGERSGYCGVDAMTDGRGLAFNHYDPDGIAPYDYIPCIWPDYDVGEGSMMYYRQSVPAEHRQQDYAQDGGRWLYPYVTMQLYDNGGTEDTVIHIFAVEAANYNRVLRYFRRVGGPHPLTPSLSWDHLTIDTCHTISNVVEAAPPNASSDPGKVALVWAAHFGASGPGDNESGTSDVSATLVEMNSQDVYFMTSADAGENWGNKYNVTKNDSLVGGWLPLGDLNAVIDTAGRLHIVWAARPFVNLTGEPGEPNDPQMDYPLFPMASRIFHWSDEGEAWGTNLDNNYISIIRDATQDWTKYDSTCFGGTYHSMSLNSPQIAQCDDKLYVTFSQFQDIRNGIWDNCHISNWLYNEYNGSANSMLYFSVSSMENGGLNWDASRALTDFTPRCDTAFTSDPYDPVDPLAINVCHSHFYNSMTRWGMLVEGGDNFQNATVVEDPSWDQTESPDYYLDVLYLDDLWPGGIVHGEGMWTVNPAKWFRLPCVDIELTPIMSIEPRAISKPSWGKPSTPANYNVRLENIGNSPLTVSSINPVEINNIDPTIDGWLDIDIGEFEGIISEVIPDNYVDITVTINSGGIVDETIAPATLNGLVVFESDSHYGYDTLTISFIVADTVQYPVFDTMETECLGVIYNNCGNLGNHGNDGVGDANMNFNDDCDATLEGVHNHAEIYLYDSSPLIMRVIDDDTLVNNYIHSADWLSERNDAFLPIEGLTAPALDGNFMHSESGAFITSDSAIKLRSDYYAPTDVDNCQYIIKKLTVYNNIAAPVNGVFVGDIVDWNIPSDSLVRNASGANESEKFVYCYGFETPTQQDPYPNNDCMDADHRLGGLAYYSGMSYHNGFRTVSGDPQGMFSHRVDEYIRDGHLDAGKLYSKASSLNAYEFWQGDPITGPESTYQDLFSAIIYGRYDLDVEDSLVFTTILASEYDGGLSGLQQTIGDARDYYFGGLCGDADNSGSINVLDIVKIFNYLYKNGGAPSNLNTADVDSINGITNHDIQLLYDYKYRGGPGPYCPPFSDSVLPVY